MSKSKFHIFQGINKQWYWNYVTKNGEITFQGEGHRFKAAAKRAIKSLIRDISRAEIEVREDK